MNIITKIYFDTKEELLNKRFYLFNKEIIIPYKEYEKLNENEIYDLKIRGNYFTFAKKEVNDNE